MNYLTVTNSFLWLGLLLCIAISTRQPTLKRKLTVQCLSSCLVAPLMAYPAYMERHELPPSFLWFDGGIVIFFLLMPLWIYRWACRMLEKAEEIKQRSAMRAAYIESLRYKEDE